MLPTDYSPSIVPTENTTAKPSSLGIQNWNSSTMQPIPSSKQSGQNPRRFGKSSPMLMPPGKNLSMPKSISRKNRSRKSDLAPPLNGRFSRIPTMRLWMKKHFTVCRSCGRISAALQEPERAICSPVWFAVLTAVKNCTTAPAKTSRPDRIISSVPLPADEDRKPVHPISSGLLFWRKVLCGICSW